MPTRIFAVSAAMVGAAVLAAAGITYAAQSESTQAATPAAQQAAPPAKRAAPPVKKAAPPVKKAAPAAAPVGTDSADGRGDEGRGHEGRDRGYGGKKEEESTSTNGRTPPARRAASPLPVGWAQAVSASTTTATRPLRSTAGSTATTVRRWPRSAPTALLMVSRPGPAMGAARRRLRRGRGRRQFPGDLRPRRVVIPPSRARWIAGPSESGRRCRSVWAPS